MAVAYCEDKETVVQPYQKVTGPLMANSHPGSYTGQDAYNDMFVVEREREETWTLSKNSHMTTATKNVANTLVAVDWKDPPCVTVKK